MLSVSPDTIRAAYLRLKQEGFITLSKNAGTVIKVQYSRKEIEQHIQAYFAPRKNTLIDINASISPLFRHALYICFRNMSSNELDKLEQLSIYSKSHFPFTMIYQYQLIFGKLENDLLMRLNWQILIFFQIPFLSISKNLQHLEIDGNLLSNMIALCRKQDFEALIVAIDNFLQLRLSIIDQFYREKYLQMEYCEPIYFRWNAYKKSKQLCYSLGVEILLAISHNIYAVDSLLPSLSSIAKEKQVSISTIQRTIKLVNQLGAVHTDNGIGTRILPMEQSAGNCNFHEPLVGERLLDYLRSLQILALSSKDCTKQALEAMDENARHDFLKSFFISKQAQQLELLVYTSLKFITYHSPLQTVKIVYTELLSLLIWGYPLRSIMHGNRESINIFYAPHFTRFTTCIEQFDPVGFASALEELLLLEVQSSIKHLNRLGIIKEATVILPYHCQK